MKDYLISLFIDNELNLDEKKEFVETVHHDTGFKDEAIDLLNQEKLLQGDMVSVMPDVQIPEQRSSGVSFFRPMIAPMFGFITAMLLVTGLFFYQSQPTTVQQDLLQHRFVIYQPDVERTEIVGDFTHWTPLPMTRIGNSGYWSTTVSLPPGEYRYSYLVDKHQQLVDPTEPAYEQDDFGGKNSIIRIAAL